VTVIKELKKGTTPTRNAGFNAATGDIIARTDADTRVPEDWIEHVENLFVRNSIDAVSGLAVYYDAPIKTDGFLSFYFWISKHLFKHPILLGPNFAITRDIWNKVKNSICTDDTKVHDDIDISIHIAKIGGTILYEPSLKVECSARRILKRPHSFFLEYAFRYVRMLLSHAYK
ncbi:MAG: glycosyltransferase, partial [bacterium]|nr:glycosyltransferase [bacterium]